jgi:DNA-binding Xre family transcriptional regulator
MDSVTVLSIKPNKKQYKSKTKENMKLCKHRGCKLSQIIDSFFCDYHADIFYYIDLANKVNVTGTNIPYNKMLTKATDNKKEIMNNYYIQEATLQMIKLELSDKSYAVCNYKIHTKKRDTVCNKLTSHSGTLCSKHLRSKLLADIKNNIKYTTMYNKYKQLYGDQYTTRRTPPLIIPEEIKQQCIDSYKIIVNNEVLLNSQCRYDTSKSTYDNNFCGKYVDEFPHLGYCGIHIHKPAAILTIFKRSKILSARVLTKYHREIICSYI